jgi:transcriptional regulator with XRE-family HTH domain
MGSTQSRRYRLFLKRLRQARMEIGLTQAAVAKKLRQPQSFLSRCETGERRVDAIELEDFARIYGKGIEFFLPEFPDGE